MNIAGSLLVAGGLGLVWFGALTDGADRVGRRLRAAPSPKLQSVADGSALTVTNSAPSLTVTDLGPTAPSSQNQLESPVSPFRLAPGLASIGGRTRSILCATAAATDDGSSRPPFGPTIAKHNGDVDGAYTHC